MLRWLCSLEHTAEVSTHDGCLLGGRRFHSGLSMLSRVYNETFCNLLKWRCLSPGHVCWLLSLLRSGLPANYWSFVETPVRRGETIQLGFPAPSDGWVAWLLSVVSVSELKNRFFVLWSLSWLSGRMSRCIATSLWDPESVPRHLCNYVPQYNPPLSQPATFLAKTDSRYLFFPNWDLQFVNLCTFPNFMNR